MSANVVSEPQTEERYDFSARVDALRCHSTASLHREPHGPYRLVGDAEDPNGLRLVHRDDEPRGGPSP